ncbi:right-handed parallel beta-helix repeat-containing protein [Hydrogenimonas urashimensis]|uniref:right-handed parallel beta-helix repeat-containing protein n=1 Tax=Hydrogenimonas urashimensis TaxID=2740515 RepID=UPI00191657E2|nr:right-handed parallel beta-helix repeat-containing protein [Hydrogenimonas urashimensis]
MQNLSLKLFISFFILLIITVSQAADDELALKSSEANAFNIKKKDLSVDKEDAKQHNGIHEIIETKIKNLLIRTSDAKSALMKMLKKNPHIPNYGMEFFVSTQGSDENPGIKTKPFKTLERARRAVFEYKQNHNLPIGGIVVWIRGGTYTFLEPFDLYYADSGVEGRRVVYRAYPGEDVHFTGGIELKKEWLKPLSPNDPAWYRLNKDARSHVYVVELMKHGIFDYGKMDWNRYKDAVHMELFEDDKMLSLARWPDKNETTYIPSLKDAEVHVYGKLRPNVAGTYVKIGSKFPVYKRVGLVNGHQFYIKRVEGKTISERRSWRIVRDDGKVFWKQDGLGYGLPKEFLSRHNGAKGTPSLVKPGEKQFGFAFTMEGLTDTAFRYYGDRPNRWKNDGDLWINGMLKYAWSNSRMKIKKIDKVNHIFHLEKAPLYGILRGRQKKAYYAYNILEELTSPGEYYIDRKRGKLYLWPEKNIKKSRFFVSINKKGVIRLNDTSWIEFNGMTIECNRGNLIEIKEGDHNLFTFTKLRASGKSLIKITGKFNGITYSDLTDSGLQAIEISGGDRARLVSAYNFAINNHIHHINRWHWTSTGAFRINGVGNIVEHNDIHDMFHQAINFQGNNHKIRYNNIYRCNLYAEDAGGIYSGRHWGWRGNEVHYNFIHDIINNYGNRMIVGVYFDDSLSGNDVVGNIFYNIDGNAVFINGGRDNKIENNLFYHVATVYVGTNYGSKYINNISGSSHNLLERLKEDGVQYQSGIWKSTYPKLAAIPNNWSQIKGSHWLYPEGNSFKNNAGAEYLKWARGPFKNNFGYYTYFSDSPVNEKSTSFKPLPYEKIGIQLP